MPLLLACGSTSHLVASDGGVDASGSLDAGPVPRDDGGAPDAAPTCTTSLATYCASKPCPDYGTATGPSSPLCGGMFSVTGSCGGLVAVTTSGVDAGNVYFYDEATHALVAVWSYVSFGDHDVTSCLGGPAGSSLPVCTGTPDYDPGCLCPPHYGPLLAGPPPLVAHASACDAAEITDFFDCALDDAGSSCARLYGDGGTSDDACVACLRNSMTGPVRVPNVPACVGLVTGDTSASGCAAGYASAYDCALSACDPQCRVVSSATATLDCVTRALANCPISHCGADGGLPADGGVAAACAIGASGEEQFRRIGTLLCGAGDAGVSDASTD